MTLPPGQMSLWLWPVSISGPAPHFIITLLSKTPVKWRARPSPKVCGRFWIFLLSQTQIRYCFTSIRDTSEGLKSKCHLLSMSFRPGAVLGGRACPVSVILCYRLWIAFSAEDGRWLTNFCGATPGWSVWCVVWGWRLPSGSGSYLTASTIPCLFYLGRAGMQRGDQAGHFKALGHACLGLSPWEDLLPSPRAHHLLLGWPRNHLRVKWKIPHLLPGPELSNVKWRDKNWPISHLNE